MTPEAVADLAQAIADLNAAAAALGLPPGWVAARPASLAEAVAAHRALPSAGLGQAIRALSPTVRKRRL